MLALLKSFLSPVLGTFQGKVLLKKAQRTFFTVCQERKYILVYYYVKFKGSDQ